MKDFHLEIFLFVRWFALILLQYAVLKLIFINELFLSCLLITTFLW
jgi:hypothetical protein